MEQPQQPQGKFLFLRAIFSDPTNFRVDIQKSMMSPQEALGILEIAKAQLMNELDQNQIIMRQK